MNATDFPLAFAESGSGEPALVLLHAFPFDRTMWQPQLESMSSAAHVLAVDLPGFGASEPAEFTVDSVADAVAGLLDALGIHRAVVGGLSMGGYIAMAFARRHPARLAGLILADTRAEADDATAKQNREKMLALVRDHGTRAVVDAMLPKLLAEATFSNRPDVVAAVRGIAERQTVGAVMTAIRALRDRPDASAALAEVAVPALVLVGELDALTPPSMAEAITSRIRGSQLVRIPNAGHMSNSENPEAFNAAVRAFLASL